MGLILFAVVLTVAIGLVVPLVFPRYGSASKGMQVLMRLAIIVVLALIGLAFLKQ